ncbi:hypothetical protein [Shimazuella alba]|uniref:Uncharacterized protein n=1 Tax=Shimazuella alba TaxID=2690964 RepID=A0A6I4W270_9BACL|nr:hypothetical protein [Shimazuella alba]MXQ54874.1 hypothetical protein [Shimazuella alba]
MTTSSYQANPVCPTVKIGFFVASSNIDRQLGVSQYCLAVSIRIAFDVQNDWFAQPYTNLFFHEQLEAFHQRNKRL